MLLAERPPGKAFAGRWEFPGGKLEPGESAREALVRELREELGIEVEECAPLLAVEHRYPGAPVRVLIDSWRVHRWRGEPASLDGQRLRWCATCELPDADILEADRPIVTALRLPALLVPGDGVPGVELRIHEEPDACAPARTRHELVGCIVTGIDAARDALACGADFLLLRATAADASGFDALGVPWYLEVEADAAEVAAAGSCGRPTGTWIARRMPR